MKDPTEDWTVATLKVHYDALLDERDRRYNERFEESKAAVEMAKTALTSSRTQVVTMVSIAVTIGIAVITGVGGLIFYLLTRK